MSVKALKKQLVAAIAMVLVAVIAVSSSTFAWFAANNTVTVEGMTVTAQTTSNLLIAPSDLTATAIPADNTFGTSLTQTVSGSLRPVSTINSSNFFYANPTKIDGIGDSEVEEYTAYNAADTTAFNTAYNTTGAVGYVDYVFVLKAQNATANVAAVDMTELAMKFAQTAALEDDTTEKAFRVGVNYEAIDEGGTFTNTLANLSILSVGGSANFEAGKAVGSTTATAALTTAGSDVTVAIPASTTKYIKVLVRLWLEGEDTTCTNDIFADLTTGSWGLELEFTLDTDASATPVSALTKTTTAYVAP